MFDNFEFRVEYRIGAEACDVVVWWVHNPVEITWRWFGHCFGSGVAGICSFLKWAMRRGL